MSFSNCFISASMRSLRAFFGAVSVMTLRPWYWWCRSSQLAFSPASRACLQIAHSVMQLLDIGYLTCMYMHDCTSHLVRSAPSDLYACSRLYSDHILPERPPSPGDDASDNLALGHIPEGGRDGGREGQREGRRKGDEEKETCCTHYHFT